MPPRPRAPRDIRSEVDFHRGEVILRLAAQYRGLTSTLLEAVQNAIDAGGTRILVGIHTLQRAAVVLDNGQGTDAETFGRALRSIGKSIKRRDQYGRFGLGLIAPVDECDECAFTSWATTDGVIRQWTFREKDIAPQDATLHIPCREHLARFPGLPKWLVPYTTDTFEVEWRTMVHLKGLKKDRTSSTIDLDEFELELRARYSDRMRERGILVRVVVYGTADEPETRDINPMVFNGEPLDEVVYDDPDTGRIVFRLYRAPEMANGRRRGEVIMRKLGDNTSIPLANFIRQARGGRWGGGLKAAFAALGSGYFEGVIECELLVLDVSRKKFVWGDAVQVLYLYIERWYEEHGNQYYEAEREQSREARWHELGLRSRDWLREALKQAELRALWEQVRDALPILDLEGGDDDLAVRPDPATTRGESRRSGTSTPGEPRQKEDAAGEADEGGEARRKARRGGGGIVFEHRSLPGSTRLWEFDFGTGVLTFNVRHPVWEMLDETDGVHTARNSAWIMDLQEWLTIQLLHLLATYPDPDAFEQGRPFVDGVTRVYARTFIMRSRRRRRSDEMDEDEE